MKQKTSERLQTVLKLAQIKERLAAEKLAEAIRNADGCAQQQEQLEQYKNEYSEQFKAVGAGVGHAGQLLNFQRFYGSLEGASKAQQQRTVLANNQREQARELWQQQYSRQKNMAGLVEKKQQQEARDEDIKVQREQDDRRQSPDAE